MNKKLYLNTFTIRILSKGVPLYNLSLGEVVKWNKGNCCLHSINRDAKKVNKKESVKLLKEAGSASFFGLD